MREALVLRHRVTAAMREFLDGEGFLDVETPVLTRSTPEGARDFLVPSRLQQGSFYALPQSPQLFKQLLMVAGFERYYQIARCFRDEDLRADRQPDFTQLDIEMSFVGVDDVIEVNERLLAHVFERVGGPAIELPIERLPYDEAMSRFGTDRPDTALRPGAGRPRRRPRRDRVQGLPRGDRVRRRRARAQRRPPRAAPLRARRADLARPGAGREGPGLGLPRGRRLALADRQVPLRGRAGGPQPAPRRRGGRPAAARRRPAPRRRRGAGPAAGRPGRALRADPGRTSDRLVWIVDWPLLEWNPGEERWDPLHHPFTAPAGEFDPDDPGGARALAYDLVWNGQEMGGGSIRIHRADVQEKVFAALGIDAEEAEARFGFLLEALRYGAPPHGGIAYGLDRIVQRLAGADSIRDVIAFPKTASGADALTGAPAPVGEMQLKELGIAPAPPRPRRPLSRVRSPGKSGQDVAMSLLDRFRFARRDRRPGPGKTPVHVDDPAFDSWEVVRDFGDVRTARAWHQALEEAGIEAVLTADWPIDRFGRGDIALRVRGEDWSEAEFLLSNLD